MTQRNWNKLIYRCVSYHKRNPFYYNAYIARFYANESEGKKDDEEDRYCDERTALRVTWKEQEMNEEQQQQKIEGLEFVYRECSQRKGKYRKEKRREEKDDGNHDQSHP